MIQYQYFDTPLLAECYYVIHVADTMDCECREKNDGHNVMADWCSAYPQVSTSSPNTEHINRHKASQ